MIGEKRRDFFTHSGDNNDTWRDILWNIASKEKKSIIKKNKIPVKRLKSYKIRNKRASCIIQI